MASANYNSLRGRKQLIRSQRVRVELDFQPSQADAEAAGLRQHLFIFIFFSFLFIEVPTGTLVNNSKTHSIHDLLHTFL